MQMEEKSGNFLGIVYRKKFSELGGMALLETIAAQADHDLLASMAKDLVEIFYTEVSEQQEIQVSESYENGQVSIQNELENE